MPADRAVDPATARTNQPARTDQTDQADPADPADSRARTESRGEPARRGRRPRHTVDELVRTAVSIADAQGLKAVTIRAVAARLEAGAMSLYSYLPDKETLIDHMVEQVSAEESPLGEPTGQWRTDLHHLARQLRTLLRRHPWLIPAMQRPRTSGSPTLADLEYGLGALEPTGMDPRARLEVVVLFTGLAVRLVQAELGEVPVLPPAEPSAALRERLAGGRHPRLAAAVSSAPTPPEDVEAHFEKRLDGLLDGLVSR